MHDGCSGSFNDGKEVVDKVRAMGFASQFMPMALQIKCSCGKDFEMETFEAKCPSCSMIHGVTPCHAFDPLNVKTAGVDY